MTQPDGGGNPPADDSPNTDTGGGKRGTRWVFAEKNMPADRLKEYKDAGYHVVLAPVTRHVDHDQRVKPIKAAGCLSGDPEYTAGHLANHPRYARYAYRQKQSSFDEPTVEHGLIATSENWWNSVHPHQRGLISPKPGEPGANGEYVIGKENEDATGGKDFRLQGWLSPITPPNAEPDKVAFDFTGMLNIYAGGKRTVAAEVLLCRETDGPFTTFAQAKDKTGYVISLRRLKGGGQALALVAWDHASNNTVDLVKWDISTFEKTWVAFRFSVRPDGVTLALLNRENQRLLPDYPPWASAKDQSRNKKRLGSAQSGNRGGYVLFGRVVDPGQGGGDEPPPPPNEGGGDGGKPPPPPPDNGGGGGGNKPPPPKPPPEQGGGNGQPPPPPAGGKPKPPPEGGGNPAPPNQGGGNKPPPEQGGGKPPPPKPPQGGGKQKPPPPEEGKTPPDNGEPKPPPEPNGGKP